MNNTVLSTRNIDDLISDIADEVVKKIGELNEGLSKSDTFKIEQPLTVPQAAVFLSLSKQTVYKLLRQKKVPCLKLPGQKRVYFLKEDLISYLKTGRKKTISEIASEAETYCRTNKKRVTL